MNQALLADQRPSLIDVREGDAVATHTVVLVGNPNVGKTTLFNALTGESASVGNYPGITVERRSAILDLGDDESVELVDVPGTYSLSARSAEEQVALEAVLGLNGNPKPSLAVIVLDAGQLARNLYLAIQLIEFQLPVVLVLSMMDEVAERPPIPRLLGTLFGVPCVGASGRSGQGLEEIKKTIKNALSNIRVGDVRVDYSAEVRDATDRIATRLPTAWRRDVEHDRALSMWALLSLDEQDELNAPDTLRAACAELRREQAEAGYDLDMDLISSRYAFIERHLPDLYETPAEESAERSWSEAVDDILLHPVWGIGIFLIVMLGVFQALFAWTDPAIGWLEVIVTSLQELCKEQLPSSIITDFIVQGVLGGVGNVIVFLPQILLLFFLIGLLEDSGYMSRVAYLTDRILRSVGLNGKAFVPMLSGLACAVPAILATRTMERRRDRLLTMMVIPLMSCSARLPVYTLIIGALFPPMESFGGVPVQGLLMLGMYVFSTATTLIAASVLGRTFIRGHRVPLLLELPRYRRPKLRITAQMMWLRAKEFLTEAGTVILGFTMLLWLLLSFPKPDYAPLDSDYGAEVQQVDRVPLEHTFGGRLGRTLEPVMAPLGFDWKLTVGIIGAFSAREVFVSTLGLVFGLDDAEENIAPLRDRLRAETKPDGSLAYPPLVGASLMVFFALACQCMSTLAVVRRETRSNLWPLALFGYMTVLAYVCSFVVYQGGQLLGFSG